MSVLSIEHTDADGSLLDGTSRGDGSAEVVKPYGWRWGRSLGLWFLPRSRHSAPRRAVIEQTAEALREAGFAVVVSIDTTPQDREVAEAEQVQREQARAERLSARADREQAAAERRQAAADQITEHRPFGQPILLGHHSQRRAERDQERLEGHMSASLQHEQAAHQAQERADNAENAARYRHNPVTVGNRIQHLTALTRKLERSIASGVSRDLDVQRWRDQLQVAAADLAHWEAVRSAQIASGQAGDYSPETVAVGDLVKIGGTWCRVVRCSPKSVSVESEYQRQARRPWHTVTDHRPIGGDPTPESA